MTNKTIERLKGDILMLCNVDSVHYYGDDRKQLGNDIQQLIEEVEKYQWVSVEDRLPNINDNNFSDFCLCLMEWNCPSRIDNPQREYFVSRMILDCGDTYWLKEDSYITHWMPLPETPDE